MIYTVVVKQHRGGPNSPMVSRVGRTEQKRPHLGCSVKFLPIFPQSGVTRSQCVKAGTEEKLVLHLLHSFAMGDSSFISIFLSTYRSFTSTKTVLDILTDRWEDLIFIGCNTILHLGNDQHKSRPGEKMPLQRFTRNHNGIMFASVFQNILL